MAGFGRLHVDDCQYQVRTGNGATGLDIYTIGDDLVHVGGPAVLTAFAGIHTGPIGMRVTIAVAPPGPAPPDDWDAVSETTLWCPTGRIAVIGLMGGTAEGLSDIPAPRGLLRVRVHARNRLHETVRADGDPPEQHLVLLWPADEETGLRTLRSDSASADWPQKPAAAAAWAMLRLVSRPATGYGAAREPDQDDRVAVVRRRSVPPAVAAALLADPAGALAVDKVLPAGDLAIRLGTTARGTMSWRWTVADRPIFPEPLTTLPDDEPGVVRLRVDDGELTLRHERVPGRHAVALGLIWDHLLDRLTGAAGGPPAWEPVLTAQAAEAAQRAATVRRHQAEQEAAQWGGRAPGERLRGVGGQATALAQLDRDLLDHLAALSADRQRELARWAARRGMRVAGLEDVGWIADALAADELPAAFTDDYGSAAFRRLLDDPDVPQTTVVLPGRGREMLQQAVAFPALLALGAADPLAAAIDAVHNAAIAHGDAYAGFLADVRAAFAD